MVAGVVVGAVQDLFSLLRTVYTLTGMETANFTLRFLAEHPHEAIDVIKGIPECYRGDVVGITSIDFSHQSQYRSLIMNVSPRWAWHGTSLDSISKILSHGFLVPPSEEWTPSGPWRLPCTRSQ